MDLNHDIENQPLGNDESVNHIRNFTSDKDYNKTLNILTRQANTQFSTVMSGPLNS